MSVRVLTIGRHVTKIRWFGGAGTAPTCLIPAWARIARFLVPRHRKGGRPCPPERWREYLDAMLYVLRTGCAWRHLPHDLTVSWSAAHKHFLRWCRNGTWARILTTVRGEVRTRSGWRRRPTAAVVDSSSVKASPVTGPRGFDGAKKIDGAKRHVLVDSAGVLVAAVVTPADVQDRPAFPKLLRKAKRIAPTISHVSVDKGYTGQTSPPPQSKPVSRWTWCRGRNPATGSSSNPAAGS